MITCSYEGGGEGGGGEGHGISSSSLLPGAGGAEGSSWITRGSSLSPSFLLVLRTLLTVLLTARQMQPRVMMVMMTDMKMRGKFQ